MIKFLWKIFNFYTTVLHGGKRAASKVEARGNTNGSLAWGADRQVYSSEYLPKGTKEKLQEIGNAIKAVYAERIKN